MDTENTQRRAPLSQHTIGPFFPPNLFNQVDNDLTRVTQDAAPTSKGEPFVFRGLVMKEDHIPVPNMILELWQADAYGKFRHPLDPDHAEADPDFLGWGRAWTTDEGAFTFHSVRPGVYFEDNQARAPHLNVIIMGAGLMRPVSTTLFFPEAEEDNAKDPVLNLLPPEMRHRLVIRADGDQDGVPAYRFDFLLRGSRDEETPFFET